MTERQPNPYFQPPQRTVVQSKIPDKNAWIVWNWNTGRWDVSEVKIGSDGETVAKGDQ